MNDFNYRDGSLLEKLDLCKTPFGRRLLRQWICSPPCHPNVIDARLDAVGKISLKTFELTEFNNKKLRANTHHLVTEPADVFLASKLFSLLL